VVSNPDAGEQEVVVEVTFTNKAQFLSPLLIKKFFSWLIRQNLGAMACRILSIPLKAFLTTISLVAVQLIT
jgi:hypothetical protein